MVLEPPNDKMLKEVFHLHDYHPYRMPDGSKNPAFNGDDSMILNVKIDKKPAAISHFAGIIDDLACADIVVAVVPGHDPANTALSGIGMVAQRVAALNGRIDGSSLLVRHTKIDKLATGGNRSIEVHLNSIKVVDKAKVLNGASVLLLDDVATSGNSLLACKQLLRAAGASQVQMFVLGKTVR
jgi:phosphoribosylpyrophosphate synthetase